jgi:hypothetical protein
MNKRRRPKKYNTDIAVHAKLRRRWRGWIASMSLDLSDLHSKREIFWELQEIAKVNSKILKPGAFFDWMCRNYITAMSIGIRSFTDYRSDVHSLGRMLFEILENPKVISRRSHVALYKGVPTNFDMGNTTFNNIVGGKRQYLSQKSVRSDLRKIEDASENVKKFVNKRIAHRAPPGQLRRNPTFDELDNALDVIDEIFCKYRLLLKAESASSSKATRQYNWTEVLWEPWVKEGSKFRPVL